MRDPFDEVCTCDYETETHHCICTRKLTPPHVRCDRCAGGKHLLKMTGEQVNEIEALRAFFGRRGASDAE